MKRKRFALLIGIASAVILMMPVGYYCFFTFVRNEHFYRGFPTSYWERAIKRWDPRASRAPSSVPYLDSLLTYLGLFGEPAILEVKPSKAALPVLVDLILSDDADVRAQAIGSLARSYELFLFCDDGNAKRYSNQVALVCRQGLLSIPGWDTYYLFLVDPSGRLLDKLSCSIESRLTCSWYFGVFSAKFSTERETDVGDIVIRYVPEKGKRLLGRWEHEIRRNGRVYTFDLNQSSPPGITSAGWKEKGLCRIAVRDGRFEVLWPPLRDFKEVSP